MSFQDFAIPELINLVASKCDLYDLEKLECVSKNIKNMIDDNVKIEKMKEVIPQLLHKYINFNSKFMLNSKNINIGDRFGFTGYIDFFRKSDFITDSYRTNIIYGYDNADRFFISILYKNQLNDSEKIVTFFQRYTTQSNFYVSCQNTFIIEGWCATYVFTNNHYDKLCECYQILFNLINNGVSTNDTQNENKYSYKLDL